MAKKKKEREAPDYEKITSVAEIDGMIQEAKDIIHKKTKERIQTKENRKDAMAGYNETLKIIEEELDHQVGVIDELNRHRRVLEKGRHLKSV